MRIKIFRAYDTQRKIMNIKHLREATGLSLRESKDIVDSLFDAPSKLGIEVYVKDNFNDDDWDAFAEWFEYQTADGATSKRKNLHLFEVINRENGHKFTAVVLATTKQKALEAAGDEVQYRYSIDLGNATVTSCEEVTSFEDGQVLLMTRL